VRDITSTVLKNGFERTVSAGYCMYLSVNGENGHAELIYLREKGSMSSGAIGADFTTVAYLSEISTKDDNVRYADGVYHPACNRCKGWKIPYSSFSARLYGVRCMRPHLPCQRESLGDDRQERIAR
jgi:hypothetical protein